jgi:hypothetical protein
MMIKVLLVACVVILAGCASDSQLMQKSFDRFSEQAHRAELSAADRTLTLTKFNFTFELPTDWYLSPIYQRKKLLGATYTYGRKGLVDSHGELIVPTVTIIPEKSPPRLDIVRYSALCKSLRPLDADEVFTRSSGRINLQEAIGYKARYVDELKVEHTMYVVHAVNNWVGIQIIMDVTSDLFPRVEGEFDQVLKSLRFTD